MDLFLWEILPYYAGLVYTENEWPGKAQGHYPYQINYETT